MTLYLKALCADRRGPYSGSKWPEPGVWVHVDGDLVPCEHGLHVCRSDQIVDWLNEELWIVESDDSGTLDAGDKTVVRRARLVRRLVAWDDRSARLFATDCAERVLHLFEGRYPDDGRPRRAIESGRAYARGEISDAARDAARYAAEAAAEAAAWAAAGRHARAAARYTTEGAARAAAWNAAEAAVRAAAWNAERVWQTRTLMALLDLTDDERARLGVDS
jgi:Imm-5 like putative immunity protein